MILQLLAFIAVLSLAVSPRSALPVLRIVILVYALGLTP
jgi:hypothetical protein